MLAPKPPMAALPEIILSVFMMFREKRRLERFSQRRASLENSENC